MNNNGIANPCFLPNGGNTDKNIFTVCVLGTARGGTSMVSGVLQIMGINMGDELNEDNLEDQDFLSHRGNRSILQDYEHPERSDFLNRAQASITKKNVAYNIWGWKDPLSIYYLRDIATLLRNPVYIWITRDSVAISEREIIMQKPARGSAHIYTYIDQVLSQYQQIGTFLTEQNRPVLLVSYERALRNPVALYLAFAEFTGLEKDLTVMEKVIDYIQPDRLTGKLGHSTANYGKESQAYYEKYLRNSLMKRQKIRAIEKMHEADLAKGEPNIATLIKAAEQDMLNRQFHVCILKLERVLMHFKEIFPIIIYGPQAISASLRYSIGQPNVPTIPDVMVKTLYLIGIALLQIGNPREAIIWFSACFDLATKKLMYRQAPLQESEKYLVWAKFHEAFSAKLLASPNLLNEAHRELETIKYTSIYMISDAVKLAYSDAMKRATVELVV